MTEPELKILGRLISDIDEATTILGPVPFIANVRARLYLICDRAPKTYTEGEIRKALRLCGAITEGWAWEQFLEHLNTPKP